MCVCVCVVSITVGLIDWLAYVCWSYSILVPQEEKRRRRRWNNLQIFIRKHLIVLFWFWLETGRLKKSETKRQPAHCPVAATATCCCPTTTCRGTQAGSTKRSVSVRGRKVPRVTQLSSSFQTDRIKSNRGLRISLEGKRAPSYSDKPIMSWHAAVAIQSCMSVALLWIFSSFFFLLLLLLLFLPLLLLIFHLTFYFFSLSLSRIFIFYLFPSDGAPCNASGDVKGQKGEPFTRV